MDSASPASLQALSKDELVVKVVELAAENSELTQQIEQLKARIEELERVVNKPPRTPRNSSVLPSRAEKENKKGGGGKKRRKRGFGSWRELCENPDKVFDVHVDSCPHCQSDLSTEQQGLHCVGEKIEVKIETHVTHARLFGCKCPDCGRRVVADAPEGFGGGSPFASSVEALVLYWHYTQSISYKRIRQMFSDVWGLKISEGAIANIIKRAEKAFVSQAAKIEQVVRGSPVVCCDETGSRVSGSKWWE